MARVGLALDTSSKKVRRLDPAPARVLSAS